MIILEKHESLHSKYQVLCDSIIKLNFHNEYFKNSIILSTLDIKQFDLLFVKALIVTKMSFQKIMF